MADSPSVKEAPIAGKFGSADDVIDLFGDDKISLEGPEEKEEPIKKQAKPEKEDEESEEKDDDLELVEPEEEEEKLDLTDDKLDIDAPPRKKEILKKYPELFKDFPFMEKVLYRDRRYTELFGSFDDAKELAEKAEVFDNFENQLLSGDTTEILTTIKDTDPKAFDKVIDNYLPNLYKADKEAYFHVVDTINKRVISAMATQGKKENNDELVQAALVMNQFLYNSSEFTPAKPRSEEKPDEKQNEAERERLEFAQERFEASRNDLQSRVDNTLRSTISEYIDPRGHMSAYVKKNAVNDALNSVHDLLSKDSTTRGNLDKLWRSAFDAKFSQDSLRKIQSFYLGKAKQHLKSVILKTRAEALKDLAPRNRGKEEQEEERPVRRTTMSPGRPAGQSKNDKGGMRKGESVMDFLSRD